MEKHFTHVADEVKKIEEWAKEKRSSYWFDDYVGIIQDKINEVKEYARDNNVPIILNAREIAERNYDSFEGYSEEESSSFYEEDSDYDEEEAE